MIMSINRLILLYKPDQQTTIIITAGYSVIPPVIVLVLDLV